MVNWLHFECFVFVIITPFFPYHTSVVNRHFLAQLADLNIVGFLIIENWLSWVVIKKNQIRKQDFGKWFDLIWLFILIITHFVRYHTSVLILDFFYVKMNDTKFVVMTNIFCPYICFTIRGLLWINNDNNPLPRPVLFYTCEAVSSFDFRTFSHFELTQRDLFEILAQNNIDLIFLRYIFFNFDQFLPDFSLETMALKWLFSNKKICVQKWPFWFNNETFLQSKCLFLKTFEGFRSVTIKMELIFIWLKYF